MLIGEAACMGYYSNGSRARKLRARWRAIGAPCALCGKPIDYDLPARHPMSFELDHIVPQSRGGDPWAWDNTQPAHRICNQRKSNRMPTPVHVKSGLPTSRDW